ncbi:MAG: hypothetical protein JSS97_06555 [Actinobacteria bacterium]|nr:hypothetical protein [Actinomycetota bacterium]
MPESDPRRTSAPPSRSEGTGTWETVRSEPLLLILPVVILVVVAVVVGLLRPANYTAEARLAVGRIDVATTAAPGVVSASQSLASAYSRAISADKVSKTLKAELGDGYGSVTASPIPESPVILIESEAESEAGAVALANAGGRALIKYINELNDNRDETEALLREYEQVQTEIPNLSPGPKLDAAQLKLESLEVAYRRNLSEETSGNDLRVLTTAQEASSDRKSKLAILVVAAIVAGVGIGLLLAYWRARVRAGSQPQLA